MGRSSCWEVITPQLSDLVFSQGLSVVFYDLSWEARSFRSWHLPFPVVITHATCSSIAHGVPDSPPSAAGNRLHAPPAPGWLQTSLPSCPGLPGAFSPFLSLAHAVSHPHTPNIWNVGTESQVTLTNWKHNSLRAGCL